MTLEQDARLMQQAQQAQFQNINNTYLASILGRGAISPPKESTITQKQLFTVGSGVKNPFISALKHYAFSKHYAIAVDASKAGWFMWDITVTLEYPASHEKQVQNELSAWYKTLQS